MKQVWHIYYATKGTAGSYIDALLKASMVAGVDACAFVSSNYRYQFGKTVKCFFPFTDFTDKRNTLVRVVRGIELVAAYAKILMSAVFSRPVIVIHLIDDLFITYLFFKLCKLVGLRVRITCHDVGSHYAGMNQRRFKILSKADELVVHNDAAAAALRNVLGESINSRIRQYPFPFSAYDEIISPERQSSARTRLRRQIGTGYYLFLGVVRRSKGIETLINAWQQFNHNKSEKLVVAGKWTDPGKAIRHLAENDDSIVLIDRYLDDEEFVQLIQDARLVVLPYHNYAHSAIIHACGTHNGAVIVSDIDLFSQMLPAYPFTSRRGDAASLAHILSQSRELGESEITHLRLLLKQAVAMQGNNLVEDLKAAYKR
jgi:glycosyltransferase involved in cell wall biosynthesis